MYFKIWSIYTVFYIKISIRVRSINFNIAVTPILSYRTFTALQKALFSFFPVNTYL